MLTSVKGSNFTLVVFKVACHANTGGKKFFGGSSLYIFKDTYL